MNKKCNYFLKAFSLILTSFVIVSCTMDSKQTFKKTQIFPESPKFFIGYYQNEPVFQVYDQNILLLLQKGKPKSFYNYEKVLKPKHVFDSLIVFGKDNKIIVGFLDGSLYEYETTGEIIDAGFNKKNNSIYFANDYDEKIKQLSLDTKKIKTLDVKGQFLFTQNQYIYFYRPSFPELVNADIDLYRISIIDVSSVEKLAERVSYETLCISTDDKYIISTSYSDQNLREHVYCVNEMISYPDTSRRKLNDSYQAYYDINSLQFCFFDTYSLTLQEVPLNCH